VAEIIDAIIWALTVAIFARVVLSWIIPLAGPRPHPILMTVARVVDQITEPILGPLRRVLPNLGMFDLSPMVALIVLWIIQYAVARQL
jgi:YggT family protein